MKKCSRSMNEDLPLSVSLCATDLLSHQFAVGECSGDRASPACICIYSSCSVRVHVSEGGNPQGVVSGYNSGSFKSAVCRNR